MSHGGEERELAHDGLQDAIGGLQAWQQCSLLLMERVLVTQLCLSLSDPMDGSLPGSLCVHGILQARILEWTAISFSSGSSRPRD